MVAGWRHDKRSLAPCHGRKGGSGARLRRACARTEVRRETREEKSRSGGAKKGIMRQG